MTRAALVLLTAAASFASCTKEAPPAPPPAPAPSAAARQAVPPPAAAPAPAAGTGSIQGEVVFTGTPPSRQKLRRQADPVCARVEMDDETVLVRDGKLMNVHVRVSRGAPAVPPFEGQAILDQVDCMYRPRVMGARTGTTLVVKNSDATMHNVHTYIGARTVFNRAMPAVATLPPITYKLTEKDVVLRLQCDVHPWMRGYVVLTDHPFFAVTGPDGKFSIPGLPPGTYTVTAWHEKHGSKSAEVTVPENGAAQVQFAYDGTEKAE